MAKSNSAQVTLWQGSLEDHPTWKFFNDEILSVYSELATDRDRPYVHYELIKRAARVAYVNHLEEQATSFLMTSCQLTRSQADDKVQAISKDEPRAEMIVPREDAN